MIEDTADTWPKILRHRFEKYGDRRRAMRHKRLGIWEVTTWKDYYLQVKALALGLLSLGLRPQDRVLIIGDNAPEWYFSQLAVQAIGGVSVGLWPDLSPQEVKDLSEGLNPRFALAADQEQVDKILSVAAAIPHLEKVIYWNYKGLAHYQNPLLLKFKEVQERGRQKDEEHPGLFEEKLSAGKADDLCAVIFTSGCEGPSPKRALHTFRSLKAGAEYLLTLDPWLPEDNLLPWAPPVQITEQWLSVGCHLLTGCTLNIAETAETHQRDMKETGPSLVFQPAVQWENQAAGTRARLENTHALSKAIYRWFMPLGYQRGEALSPLKKLLLSLGDRLLFHPLKKSLGLQHARICYSFGSVVSPEVQHFFRALDLPWKNVYVSTEAGPLCGFSGKDWHPETLGPLTEREGAKISLDGELYFRRDALFSGYLGIPHQGLFTDGWYHSGDGARKREDGQVEILGRLSEMTVFKDGRTFAPQAIESRLRFSPYIREAWVWADEARPGPSALVVLNYAEVCRWAGRKRIPFSGPADLCLREEVQCLIGEEIRRIQAGWESPFRIEKFVLLPRDLDPDLGETTRNRKLRRFVLQDRFRALREAIRQDREEGVVESALPSADGEVRIVQSSLRIITLEDKG